MLLQPCLNEGESMEKEECSYPPDLVRVGLFLRVVFYKILGKRKKMYNSNKGCVANLNYQG
jgi:hypothetical protein